MVPPKKYRYFFTHARESLLDASAQTEELPIAESHCFQIEQERFDVKVDRVSFRTSKAKRVANESN
jgi:hypothetical protein